MGKKEIRNRGEHVEAEGLHWKVHNEYFKKKIWIIFYTFQEFRLINDIFNFYYMFW